MGVETKQFIVLNIDNEIHLKQIKKEDVNIIFETIINNKAYLKEWLPFISDEFDIDHVRFFVEDALSIDSKELVFTINNNNKFIGIVSLKDLDYTNQKTEIGYWISEDYQHKGIISKSCKKLIEYAFTQLNFNRIQLKAAKNNFKSQAVAKRLGFIREGVEREGELHSDGFVDLVIFGLLKNDNTPFFPV